MRGGGGASLSAATAGAVGTGASIAATARTRIVLRYCMALAPSLGGRGPGGDRRAGKIGLGDRGGQWPRRLDQPEQRQNDQEVDEVPRGEEARRDYVATLRRLRPEPAEP